MNALEKFDPVIEQINQIREEGNFLPDCSTKEGYEKSKRFVLDITMKARKALEARHKEVKAPFAQAVKDIDSKKNELMTILKEIEKPHQEAYKAIDQAEKDKKQQFENMLEAKVQTLIDLRSGASLLSIEELEERISEAGETDTSEGFYHRSLDAAKERERTLFELETVLTQKREIEAMKAENAQLKKERVVDQAFDSVFNPSSLGDPEIQAGIIVELENPSILAIAKVAGVSEIQAGIIVEAIKADQIPSIKFIQE